MGHFSDRKGMVIIMKNTIKSIISMILCISFILSCFSLPVVALPEETGEINETAEALEQTEQNVQITDTAETTAVIDIPELPDEDVPEVLTKEKAKAKGHIKRLRDEEKDLNTLVFENANGTKTTYVYMKPVKYIENGAIKDKSSKITMIISDDDSFAMKDNSTKVTFAKKADKGVKIEYNDYKITFAPVTDSKTAPSYDENNNSVAYEGVFGEGTRVVYNTTLYGLKEDIVLDHDIGVYSFDFDYTLKKLTPICSEEGIWSFVNDDGEKIATLGSIIIKDSAGNKAVGGLTVTQVKNKEYTVTVTAPEEFLKSRDTVYPVYIDPTVTVEEMGYIITPNASGNGYEVETYDAIIDVGTYSTSGGMIYANENVGKNFIGYSGYHDSTGKIIYKFTDFYESYGRFVGMSSSEIDEITSVIVHIPFASVPSDDVIAYPMSGTWDVADLDSGLDVTSPRYLSLSCISNYIDTSAPINMSVFELAEYYTSETETQAYYEGVLDITDLAIKWMNYPSPLIDVNRNPANGFILTLDSTENYVEVYSVENVDMNLYYEVDSGADRYKGSYLLSNINSNHFMWAFNNKVAGKCYKTAYANTLSWIFEPLGSNLYVIKSVSTGKYLYCYQDSDNKYSPALHQVVSEITEADKWEIVSVSDGK